jgi:hypothetical protein
MDAVTRFIDLVAETSLVNTLAALLKLLLYLVTMRKV